MPPSRNASTMSASRPEPLPGGPDGTRRAGWRRALVGRGLQLGLLVAATGLAWPLQAEIPVDPPPAERPGAELELAKEGERLFREGRFGEAEEKFRQANRLSPRYSFQWNIARSLQEAGRIEQAAAEFRIFLDLPGVPAAQREAAETRLAELVRQHEQRLGVVILRCQPAGARVALVGRGDAALSLSGICPFQANGLPPGGYQMQVQATGHDPATLEVELGAGQTAEQTLALRPHPGKLIVASSRAGGEVFIDGHRQGQTPLVERLLPAGRHLVIVTYPGGVVWEGTVQLPPGGSLLVQAEPGGAPAPGPSPTPYPTPAPDLPATRGSSPTIEPFAPVESPLHPTSTPISAPDRAGPSSPAAAVPTRSEADARPFGGHAGALAIAPAAPAAPWWSKVALASGAAALAAGGFFLYRNQEAAADARDAYDDYLTEHDPGLVAAKRSRVEELQETQQLDFVLGAAAAGTGLVLAGLGVVGLLAGGPTADEDAPRLTLGPLPWADGLRGPGWLLGLSARLEGW